MPILHEHFEPGSPITEIQAHNDMITSIDFDYPYGTMVSAAMDDTVRVWDLNAGRCTGFLEGHQASVRCLQVDDNIVATGSMDASVKLWDLSRARSLPKDNRVGKHQADDGSDDANHSDSSPARPSSSSNMEDCYVFSLDGHVDEVTAIHFQNDNLISGSSDKTLRQWDLATGRCVQTLDVLWAAAQASSLGGDMHYKPAGRVPDASADFVGAIQSFDAALACGTADGMVRLWDLRSGQVHRSLVGHTGPVSCLQFDDMHMVTGSLDRSIRVCIHHSCFRPFLTVRIDLGSSHRVHLRRVCFRPSDHEHDVRHETNCNGRRRECGQGVRQGRWESLGLRRRGWRQRRGTTAGSHRASTTQGRVSPRGPERRDYRSMDLLSGVIYERLFPGVLFASYIWTAISGLFCRRMYIMSF